MIFKNDWILKPCCKMRVVKFWILILSIVPFTTGQLREIEYECGAHGRFEYCIDGIPGCVIGCHCHPGYYFDTDTKVCEPNIKLTQNFRRQYDYFEPTRIYAPPITTSVMEELTTTVKSAIDQKLDVITKDADDLGEWLYNQFFKTIENQVINETKDEGILTRRSGSEPVVVSKPSRRSHKYWKARRKKKRKRKGLKSKLLRITEDDSLFDSSSGSTSDDSSGSSSSYESSSEDSKEKKEIKDRHGHKKLILYNKRPKLPLPSFIFLPNMETPFYPPIGLPPPPIPMYPMVPVPPMMQYPYPEATPHTHNNEQETTTSASTTSESVSTTTPNGSTIDQDAASEVYGPEENLGKSPEENRDAKESEGGTEEAPPALLRGRQRPRGGSRNKLMHKLRDKLKRKNKYQNFFANEYQEPPTPPFIDAEPPANCLANPEPNIQMPLNLAKELRGLQDVDFKYLSQLIHIADLNKNNSTTPREHIINAATHPPPPPNRRINNDNYPDITQLFYNLARQPIKQNDIQHQTQITDILPKREHNAANLSPPPYRKKIEATNDTYYSNLGRQIAAMIRNLDGEKEVDIEISNSINSNKRPVFNGDSQGYRSYWERSIRSPFNYLKNTLRKEMSYFKNSNENLFSLENRVEIAASTKPTLGLNDLENIISKMEKAKSNLIKKHVGLHRTVPSKTSFNVNLLSGNDRAFHSNVNKESQNLQSNNRQYNSYTRRQSVQSPSQLRPQSNVYAKTQNGQSASQFGLENNVYTRRQIEQSTSQVKPEKYISTNYHSSLPESTIKRNGTALQRNIFRDKLPTRKPNTIETQEYIPNTIVAQQYGITNNVIKQQYNSLDTVVAQQYRIPDNVIERQYKIPDTVFAKKYKVPNNNFQPYTVMPLPLKLPQAENMKLPFMQVGEIKARSHQLDPIMNHKNFNYYPRNNNNRYLFEKASLPLEFPSSWNGKQLKTSYFHNEFDNFDNLF